MSNFQNFLKSLNVNIDVDIETSYVVFDKELGTVDRISNVKPLVLEDTQDVLEVKHDEVASILEGKSNTNEFLVAYDVVLKQLVLKKLSIEDELESIESQLYRLPVYRSSSRSERRTLLFENIYDGVNVYIWSPLRSYKKDDIIWYQGNVYIVQSDMESADELDLEKVTLYISDVFLSDVETNVDIQIVNKNFKPIYEGIHVDVWYDELDHLSGQHVWINNSVYRLLLDQEAGTPFNIENAELVVSNIQLYDDENKYLKFTEKLQNGNKVLKFNKMFMYSSEVSLLAENSAIVFYLDDQTPCYFDEPSKMLATLAISSHNINEEPQATFTSVKTKVDVYDPLTLESGSKVLIGKSLSLVRSKEVFDSDINLVQNNAKGSWNIYLGKKTAKALQNTNWIGIDTMYFSVTSKFDPNVLYRTLEFSLNDLVAGAEYVFPFKYAWEHSKEDISVYATKYFETYAHEIVE